MNKVIEEIYDKIAKEAAKEAAEKTAKETSKNEKMRFALNLIKRGRMTYEEIAEDTGLTATEVEEIAENLSSAAS